MNNQIDKDNNQDEVDLKVIESYENEDKRRYPPLLLLVFLTTFAVLVALGLSFAAISYLGSNETINTIISSDNDNGKDKYIITYVENATDDGTPGSPSETGIYLVNQFPTSDEDGKKFEGEHYVYNFTLLIGKKTAGVYYELTAVPNTKNTLSSNYVKLYLEKNDQEVPFSLRTNGKVKTFSEYQKSIYEEADGMVIYSGTITEEEAKTGKIKFVMRMWVSEDTPSSEFSNSKSFEVKVNVYARSKAGNK